MQEKVCRIAGEGMRVEKIFLSIFSAIVPLFHGIYVFDNSFDCKKNAITDWIENHGRGVGVQQRARSLFQNAASLPGFAITRRCGGHLHPLTPVLALGLVVVLGQVGFQKCYVVVCCRDEHICANIICCQSRSKTFPRAGPCPGAIQMLPEDKRG